MTRLGSFWRRNTMTIGIVVIVMAFGTILFLQAVATSKLQQQTEQQAQIIKQIKDVATSLNDKAADRTTQINGINRHLDCIVVFFAQPDRANKQISDIDTCTFKDQTTGATTHATGILEPGGSNSGAAGTSNNDVAPGPAATPAPATQPSSTPTPSGGSSQPVPFLQRILVNPIKSIINAL